MQQIKEGHTVQTESHTPASAADYSDWLVVSDIDGTLNNKFRKLPRNNYNAILDFTQKGGHFTLASGRAVSSLERNYRRVTPNCPAVVLNGAGIYDYDRHKMLWRSTIGPEGRSFVQEVYEKYAGPFHRVDIGIFFDDHVYIVRSGVLSLGQMFFDKTSHEVTTLDKVPEEGWMKVIFWSNPLTILKLKNYLKNTDSHDLTFMASSPWSLEMLQKGTNKGTAVLRLGEMLGVPKEHIGAIGDYYNDEEMLKTVAIPACAGQAPKDLKAICKYVACHCNRGCVADFIGYIRRLADSEKKQGKAE